ncbi:hypothetical protein T492DRAFT_975499 [Pavlovales sp. CCMP2436]|nr:hypothetical protein T492DRAFT_975499 [Pavlovales sp. CCMP2436]
MRGHRRAISRRAPTVVVVAVPAAVHGEHGEGGRAGALLVERLPCRRARKRVEDRYRRANRHQPRRWRRRQHHAVGCIKRPSASGEERIARAAPASAPAASSTVSTSASSRHREARSLGYMAVDSARGDSCIPCAGGGGVCFGLTLGERGTRGCNGGLGTLGCGEVRSCCLERAGAVHLMPSEQRVGHLLRFESGPRSGH